jgi:hypothetical protein
MAEGRSKLIMNYPVGVCHGRVGEKKKKKKKKVDIFRSTEMTNEMTDDGLMWCMNRMYIPVGVDTTEKVVLEFHVVELVDNLVPVGLLCVQMT